MPRKVHPGSASQEDSVPNSQEMKEAAEAIDYGNLARELDASAESFLQEHVPTQETLDFLISV